MNPIVKTILYPNYNFQRKGYLTFIFKKLNIFLKSAVQVLSAMSKEKSQDTICIKWEKTSFGITCMNTLM